MRTRVLALLTAILLFVAASPASAAFTYYKTATLNGSTQGGSTDSTSWPLTIARDGTVQALDTDLKDTNTGGPCRPDGFDIRPYADAALTTPLTYQLVFYDGTVGKIEMHVLISTLHHLSNDVIYLAYANASLSSDGSSTSTWNAAFTNIYHVKNGAALTLTDSTAGAYTLTNVNVATAVAGEIDGGVNIVRASNQYLITANAPTNAYPLTLEAWARLANTTFSAGAARIMVSIDKTSAFENFWIDYWSFSGTTYLRTLSQAAHAASFNYYPATIDTSWHYIVGIFTNSTTQALYQDGVLLTPNSAFLTGNTPSGLTDTMIGAELENTAVSPFVFAVFDGDEDEIRVSNVVRGPDWVLQTYNAQKPSSTFITWGTQTVVPTTAAARLPLMGVGK